MINKKQQITASIMRPTPQENGFNVVHITRNDFDKAGITLLRLTELFSNNEETWVSPAEKKELFNRAGEFLGVTNPEQMELSELTYRMYQAAENLHSQFRAAYSDENEMASFHQLVTGKPNEYDEPSSHSLRTLNKNSVDLINAIEYFAMARGIDTPEEETPFFMNTKSFDGIYDAMLARYPQSQRYTKNGVEIDEATGKAITNSLSQFGEAASSPDPTAPNGPLVKIMQDFLQTETGNFKQLVTSSISELKGLQEVFQRIVNEESDYIKHPGYVSSKREMVAIPEATPKTEGFRRSAIRALVLNTKTTELINKLETIS